MESERQGAANQQKSRQSRKKAGYYKQQSLVTARNKNRRAIKRNRAKPKQEQRIAYRPDGTPFKKSAILWRKQSMRKARNIRRRQSMMAARTVLVVEESTAE
jgi:hypothetical protein